jgi:hypothetical protein
MIAKIEDGGTVSAHNLGDGDTFLWDSFPGCVFMVIWNRQVNGTHAVCIAEDSEDQSRVGKTWENGKGIQWDVIPCETVGLVTFRPKVSKG